MQLSFLISTMWLTITALFLPVEKSVLSGKITDPAGRPVANANILIMKKGRELVAGITSGEDGTYRQEVAPGMYDVECIAASFVTRRYVDVPVRENTNNVLDFFLEKEDGLEETVVQQYGSLPGNGHSKPGVLTADELRSPEPDIAVKYDEIAVREKRETERAAKTRATMLKAEPASKAKRAPAADKVVIDGARKDVTYTFEAPDDYKSYEEVTIVADETKAAPPPGAPAQPSPRAGLLTAGEWSDLHNWNRHWADLLADGEIDTYQNMYGFFPKQRFTVLLTTEQDFPLGDVAVTLKSAGETIWEARTDNTGKAELWAGLFDKKEFTALEAEALVEGQKHDLGRLKPAKDGINRFRIEAACKAPKNVDIVWAVDATGSMGDEIEYLKTELLDVIGRAKGRNPGLSFRMGTVFYRDVSDAYITASSGLSGNIAKTVDFIKKQSADGGGDYPEAVHSALEEAIHLQDWSKEAIARICFLVLDASPHQTPEVNASLQKSIREAAKLGIRIVPVTASGIQKDTEFLMKFFGLATNGTYVFLTDHSGIGGKHLEPTTDEYKVEPLNELLVRLIAEYTTISTCEGKSTIRFEDDPQQQQPWQALYYPNPASTQFILELPFDVQSVTIYDSEGKAVRKLEKPVAGQNTVIVSDLAAGFYTIRILKDGRMQSGKLMVVRA